MECNFRTYTIRWQMSKSTNVYHKFYFASSYCFREVQNSIFDHQKVDHGHRAQYLLWHRSMANVKIYKLLPHIFGLALTISQILTFTIFDLQKVGQSHEVQFLQWWQISMANIKIYKNDNFFIFAKVWPVLIILTHMHAHTHAHTHTHTHGRTRARTHRQKWTSP